MTSYRVHHGEHETSGKKLSNKYLCLEDFVLKNGKRFTLAPLPSGVKSGELRHCFENAFHLACSSNLTYVEGYANEVVPVLHAWCIDNKGKVVDPTWVNSFNNPDTAYFGVPMKLRFVMKSVFRSKHYSVLDDWKNNWPILRARKSEWEIKCLQNTTV